MKQGLDQGKMLIASMEPRLLGRGDESVRFMFEKHLKLQWSRACQSAETADDATKQAAAQ